MPNPTPGSSNCLVNKMAYDEKLAVRIRVEFHKIPFVEKKMFGGVGFLINGNMACGVYKNDLIVRVDPQKHESLLKKPGARPFDITGKPMKGWLMVDADGTRTERKLSTWVQLGVKYALSLPPK